MTHRTTRRMSQIVLFLAVLAIGLMAHPVWTLADDPEGKDATLHLVSGTLLKLDLSNGRGLLRTDLGRPIHFDVPKAYLFENVIVGARIALRLDEQGRAVKVMDTSIPDLLTSPDRPLAAHAEEER